MSSQLGRAPFIPSSCARCPISDKTVCQAFHPNGLETVQRFKTGDRSHSAGSQLYRPGERCAELYNLLDGWVALYRIEQEGRRQILDIAVPGSFLGFEPDFSRPMLHGAECITDVSICVFPKNAFHQLVERHPPLASRLIYLNARDKLIAQDHLTNLGTRSAQARIAHLLLSLHIRVSRYDKRSETVIPLTQSHIADALGLTTVYVSQTLKQLREKNLLMFKAGRLQILAPDGLADIADFDHLLLV